MSCSDEDDSYGPPLPPGFKSKHEEDYKPALPPHLLESSSQGSTKRNHGCEESDTGSSESESYIPALPPHMQKSVSKENDKHQQSDSSDDDAYLPPLPLSLQRHDEGKRKNGESEAQQTKFAKRDCESEESEDDNNMYGPALPAHLIKSKTNQSSLHRGPRIKGPTLPAGFVPPESLPSFEEMSEEEEDNKEDSEEEERGPMVGPMPSKVAFNEEEYRIQQLELRAKKMKDKLEGKFDDSKAVKRETWMLELPEDKPNFCGLAPRQFLKKAPQEKGDCSVWTDTPVDKERKAKMEIEGEKPIPEKDQGDLRTKQRNDDLTAKVDKYNEEKRAKPLIDLHKKKLKEKNKESKLKEERRPFSREDDMNVNKFDEAQKSNILKKARQLNDRFDAGDRKFL